MSKTKIKPSIIGRTYIPCDNSYAICLSEINTFHGIADGTHDYLAGTRVENGETPKECIILTEPFTVTLMRDIRNHVNPTPRKYPMIIVEWNNKQYMYLYY